MSVVVRGPAVSAVPQAGAAALAAVVLVVVPVVEAGAVASAALGVGAAVSAVDVAQSVVPATDANATGPTVAPPTG